jgi:hypothetical protein
MQRSKPLNQKEEELLEWVKEQPGMLEHLARFKAVAKPKIDELNKIELVEDELLKIMHGMTADILGQWAQEKHDQALDKCKGECHVKLHSKKNS